jgi:hypothetical protein
MLKLRYFLIIICCYFSMTTSAQVSWNTNGNSINAGDFIGTLNGFPLSFKTAPSSTVTPIERLHITEIGDIGIGTNSPISLWPAGRVFQIEGIDPAFRISDANNASASWQLNNNTSSFYSNIPYRFYIDNGSFFSVVKNTNISGVFNPASFNELLKLNDQGMLYVRGIKVRADNFPDYVFDKNYELLSLDSLKAYIVREKHLPDIPAANEVEKNGLDIGENQKLLLKKIEELTLYILTLKEEIQQLKKTEDNK